MNKRIGKQTIAFEKPPNVASNACVVGKKEGAGPLENSFDYISEDDFFGEETWEKAESRMMNRAVSLALDKGGFCTRDIDYVFAGDLLNQCMGSSFGMRDMEIPFFGVYGACSTMAESIALGAAMVDGGFARATLAATSSHFCSAERQFRYPLEYGGIRPPTSQWTVTGSGAMVLTQDGNGPYVTHVTAGKIVDAGIKDANNMGAAMAPAAHETMKAHFEDLGIQPSHYDLIVTGDLGKLGAEIVTEFLRDDGFDIAPQYNDCGLMIYSLEEQDVNSGASGCGCSASVLNGYIMNGMREGRWQRVLFAATGAMLSTVSTQQGESIPSICHAVSFSATR